MAQQESATTTTSACPHPEAVGTRWGDPISEERQAELQGYLDRWEGETDHGERKGPFDKQPGTLSGVVLTGADVFCLARQSELASLMGAPNLHLEGANLTGAHLEGANLIRAHLEGAKLDEAHLEDTYLFSTHFEGASLHKVHLERAALQDAHLESASMILAHLEGSGLMKAHLEDAILADAHLEGARFIGACMEGVNLRNAWMDKATLLNKVSLDRASLDQLSFDGANLAVVKWDAVKVLGDEVRAHALKYDIGLKKGERKSRQTRLDDYEAAIRANLQLAAQLRAQGMSEQADRFTYQAQKLQKTRYRLQHRYGQWFFSWLLYLLAGYGYRPVRSLIAYVLVILGFAAAYFTLGGANSQALSWNEAIVISMTAFHGRGFFSAVFQPGDLQAAVAAVEAFIGLLIEIVLIATFTQRFFAR